MHVCFLSRSLCRSWQQQSEAKGQPPPEYDFYDPRLDHRFLPRLGREIDSVRLQLLHALKNSWQANPASSKPKSKGSSRSLWAGATCLVAFLLFFCRNLEVVPVSGRWRFNIISNETVERSSEGLFSRVLREKMDTLDAHVLPESDPRTKQVRRVVARLLPASGLQDRPWEVYVFDSPKIVLNAFLVPGETVKICVFGGMLELANTEGQLAGMLSHEIAHRLARHPNEGASRTLGGILALPIVLLFMKATPWVWPVKLVAGMAVGALGYGLIELPMSRANESEADFIGLMMMAEACYDPRDALLLWQKFERVLPERNAFLMTHPTDEDRIKNIKKWLPEALEKREQSGSCWETEEWEASFRQAVASVRAPGHI